MGVIHERPSPPSPTRANCGRFQCAEVKNTTNRMWVRLVGRRHDVQFWTTDTRQVPCPYSRAYPMALFPTEKWVKDILEPYRRQVGSCYQIPDTR